MAEVPKKVVNPHAAAKNFEQTCKTESEVPHKWNETWGQLFFKGIPYEYEGRIKYLEEQLKNTTAAKLPPKYGVGAPFKDIGIDFKRKKMFRTEAEKEDDAIRD